MRDNETGPNGKTAENDRRNVPKDTQAHEVVTTNVVKGHIYVQELVQHIALQKKAPVSWG